MAIAFVERSGSGRPVTEWEALAQGFSVLGYKVQRFHTKELTRRKLLVTAETPVAGQIPSVQEALRQLGISPPAPLDYPQALLSYMKRRVWKSSVGRVTQSAWDDVPAVFVKPARRQKGFTGFVLDGPDTLCQFEGVGKKQEIWCSTPVCFLSEWRAFVLNHKLLGAYLYTGDEDLPLNTELLDEMIARYAQHDAPVGYALDIGVLDNGETALVEVNDGFGLGKYGLSDALYTDLTLARWQELTQRSEAIQ
jgi:hypothetical protein